MLQRCSSSNNSSNTSFSIIFPMSSPAAMDHETGVNIYSSSSSSFYSNPIASSVVDCTLSLGTPSTRHTNATTSIQRSSCTKPSFCWDIINNATTTNNSQYSKSQQTPAAANLMGADPLLLARRCANCDTTSTPLWRNGPRGPKSLCNACGIRYKKEERRAAASTSSPTVVSATSSSTESINYAATSYPAWTCYPAAASSTTGMKNSTSPWCGQNEESNYFSWRLNVVPPSQFPVTDNRPSLFQYQ